MHRHHRICNPRFFSHSAIIPARCFPNSFRGNKRRSVRQLQLVLLFSTDHSIIRSFYPRSANDTVPSVPHAVFLTGTANPTPNASSECPCFMPVYGVCTPIAGCKQSVQRRTHLGPRCPSAAGFHHTADSAAELDVALGLVAVPLALAPTHAPTDGGHGKDKGQYQ